MKNKDIITLGNAGFFRAAAHSIPVEHFYKFVKWKRDLQKAYIEIGRTQEDFRKEAGIKMEDLQPDAKPDQEALERYFALNEAFVNEDNPVTAKRIPIEFYKGLYDENGDLFTDPDIEAIVLDNLFKEDDNE